MEFGLLINRHNDPNKGESEEMIPREYERPHTPIKLSLDVHPVIEKSVEWAKRCFPERFGGLPLIMYDTSHGGNFAGFVVPYEEFKDENGVSSKLEARISFEGKADKSGVVSHRDLSRVHLSAYARRTFSPKEYEVLLKSVLAEKRETTRISEIVNVSFRWADKEGFRDLDYQKWWNLPETQYGDRFDFHKTRSSYFESFCVDSDKPATERKIPLLPLSPTLDCMPSGIGFGELREFIRRTIDESKIIPAVGIRAIEKTFPKFPEPPKQLARESEFPTPDDAPDYLFGTVLPYLKRFVSFEL